MQAYFLEDISAEAISRLLAWGKEKKVWHWLYGEQMTQITLAYLVEELEISPSAWRQWSHGRVFGDTCELAWWSLSKDQYALRLLIESGDQPPGLAWGVGEEWLPWGGVNATLLHGSLDTKRSKESGQPSWSEARIPRYLHYPVKVNLDTVQEDDVIQVILETQPYAQHGVVGLSRLAVVRLT